MAVFSGVRGGDEGGDSGVDDVREGEAVRGLVDGVVASGLAAKRFSNPDICRVNARLLRLAKK